MNEPLRDKFWEHYSLEELTPAEWEALCDGCARCCLVKLEDEEDGALYYTDLACQLLDCDSCRCTDYSNRTRRVPDCLTVTVDIARRFPWLPYSCAYRRLAEGRGLAPWHPLISGEQDSVLKAGISVRGRVIPEQTVAEDDYEDHVITWVRS